jgi:hypothetical protein
MLYLSGTGRKLRSVWREAVSLCLVVYGCPVAVTLKQVGCIGWHAREGPLRVRGGVAVMVNTVANGVLLLP